jgi:hypothetical protein
MRDRFHNLRRITVEANPAMTYRATAGAQPRQGEFQICACGRSMIDARGADPGQPQTNIRICGQTRESEHDHRRLKAAPPPLHDHRIEHLSRKSRRGQGCRIFALAIGHQSADPGSSQIRENAIGPGSAAHRSIVFARRSSFVDHAALRPGHGSVRFGKIAAYAASNATPSSVMRCIRRRSPW